MAAQEQDYYELLGVGSTATLDEIKHGFRQQARKCHPDVSAAPDAAVRFKRIHEAYDTLSDPQKRQVYNATRARPQSSASGAGASPHGPTYGPAAGTTGRPHAQTPPPSRGGGTAGADNLFSSYMSDLDDILASLRGDGAKPGAGPMSGASPTSEAGPTSGADPKAQHASFPESQRTAAPGAERRDAQDIVETVTISLEEAARGTQHTATVEREETCPACHGLGERGGPHLETCDACKGTQWLPSERNGPPRLCHHCTGTGYVLTSSCPTCLGAGSVRATHTLQVTIPAGVADGQRIRLRGQGHPGLRGGPAGDLYLSVHVQPSRALKREGDDVHSGVTITADQARRGAKTIVKTLYGRVELTIPPHTGDGATIRLRGQGFPRHGVKGDHLVRVAIGVSPQQRARAALHGWTRRARALQRRAQQRIAPLKRTLIKRPR